MELGVLIPIGNNGWLISTTSPQYMPSFDLNRQVVEKAERFGFDFALSMIKLHGFGGPSQYWDHNLEIIYLDGGAGGGNHPHSAFRLGRGANSLFHYFQRHSIHWPPLSRIGPLREIRSMGVPPSARHAFRSFSRSCSTL